MCTTLVNFSRKKRSFKKLGYEIESEAFLLSTVILASTAYHDCPGPAETGIAIVLKTLNVNMLFIQLDCTQLLIWQQNYFLKPRANGLHKFEHF